VALEVDIEALRDTAARRARALDDGDGVLVLTDLYGSTPSNIAASLAGNGAVRVVAGLNCRCWSGCSTTAEDLPNLAEKAVSGGIGVSCSVDPGRRTRLRKEPMCHARHHHHQQAGAARRAAAKFVSIASRFGAEIHLQRGNQRINGKSIMGVMMWPPAREPP